MREIAFEGAVVERDDTSKGEMISSLLKTREELVVPLWLLLLLMKTFALMLILLLLLLKSTAELPLPLWSELKVVATIAAAFRLVLLWLLLFSIVVVGELLLLLLEILW